MLAFLLIAAEAVFHLGPCNCEVPVIVAYVGGHGLPGGGPECPAFSRSAQILSQGLGVAAALVGGSFGTQKSGSTTSCRGL